MQSFCLPLWCAAGGLSLPGAVFILFVGAVCGLPVLYSTGKGSRVLLGVGVVCAVRGRSDFLLCRGEKTMILPTKARQLRQMLRWIL